MSDSTNGVPHLGTLDALRQDRLCHSLHSQTLVGHLKSDAYGHVSLSMAIVRENESESSNEVVVVLSVAQVRAAHRKLCAAVAIGCFVVAATAWLATWYGLATRPLMYVAMIGVPYAIAWGISLIRRESSPSVDDSENRKVP